MSARTRFSTSMAIAAAELLAARRERRHDLPARLARACMAACGTGGERLLRRIDSLPGRAALRLAETAMLPGIAAHYRWRKCRIRRWLQAELEAGARQLLVLGVGFDASGPCMLAEHPSLRVFEIDRADTVAIRRRALRELRSKSPRLVLQPADLSRDRLRDVVRGLEGFDHEADTAVVAEGLLMYLPPRAVSALWRDLRRTCGARVAVIATAMGCDGEGIPRFRRQRPWLRRWLAARDEPFLWGAMPGQLHATMLESGIAVTHVADPDDPANPDPSPGEWLFRGSLRPA